ncbi:hypothetical protein RUND412_011309, partial [Rhizina undulata]
MPKGAQRTKNQHGSIKYFIPRAINPMRATTAPGSEGDQCGKAGVVVEDLKLKAIEQRR